MFAQFPLLRLHKYSDTIDTDRRAVTTIMMATTIEATISGFSDPPVNMVLELDVGVRASRDQVMLSICAAVKSLETSNKQF